MASFGGGPVVDPRLLYFIITLLTCYAIVDLLANHSDLALPSLLLPQACSRPGALPSTPDICATLQGHLDINLSVFDEKKKGMALTPQSLASLAQSLQDPWRQMKWVGPAATCRVKGLLIERLDPALNFRRGFALRFAANVEDKTHLLPWLLGARLDLAARPRRVYLDLGANAFSTSITWFARMYPVDFTEVHAFEADQRLLSKPAAGFDEEGNYAGRNAWSRMVSHAPGIPTWMLDRIRVYSKLVGDGDDLQSRAINITRFMKEELRLRAQDAVVVKMDIEGSEWPILERWMQDPDMAAIVDELFVEVHYDHPSMRGYHWARFAPTTREQALVLLARLRLRGFYAHAWP